jgi:bifunctional DNA-binding transcriptional regulator/antitoxin component of YhaV-PrlF toxin-antitoxin module
MADRTRPSGFGEASQQGQFDAGVEEATDGARLGARLKVGPGGRVLIPVGMRLALGVAEGDMLLATLENGELHLMSAATAVKRAQAMVRAHVPQGAGSMVDALLAERRADNARDVPRDGL